MPYENVSDWKVYPDIPVLVQYHDRGSGKTGKTGRGHGNTSESYGLLMLMSTPDGTKPWIANQGCTLQIVISFDT
jgi:hypothetical protein